MKIGFVGVGKLGRDAAEVMQEIGHDVVGYDVADVNTTIPMAETLADAVLDKEVVFVAVPTPHHPDYDGRYPTSHLEPKDFDYSIAKETISLINEVFLSQLLDCKPANRGRTTIVVLISTVLPGTVRREIAPLLTSPNIRFVYNPYLIAQGTVKWDMKNPEMIMIGTESGEENWESRRLIEFYQDMVENNARIVTGTWEEMESIKVFYNTFITTKLCLVNMIQDVAMKVGNANVDVITDALKNSTMRIMGPAYMTAGLGDGGGCHPRDNIAMRHMAADLGLGYDLFDAIVKTREEQAKNMALFMERIGIEKPGEVVILGKGFKPGVDQDFGSPSILVGYYMAQLGYSVTYDDQHLRYQRPGEPLSSKTYFLAWPKKFDNWPFTPGSTVIDPWRSCVGVNAFGVQRSDLKIYHYGDTRLSADGRVL